MDYHNFSQVMIPIAAVVSDVVSLLEQIITHSLVSGMQLWIWQIPFSPYLSISSLLSAGNASDTLLLSSLRAILIR